MASNKSLHPISNTRVLQWTHIWPPACLGSAPSQPVPPIFSEHNSQNHLQAAQSPRVVPLDMCSVTTLPHQQGYPHLSVLRGVPRRRRGVLQDLLSSQIRASDLVQKRTSQFPCIYCLYIGEPELGRPFRMKSITVPDSQAKTASKKFEFHLSPMPWYAMSPRKTSKNIEKPSMAGALYHCFGRRLLLLQVFQIHLCRSWWLVIARMDKWDIP